MQTSSANLTDTEIRTMVEDRYCDLGHHMGWRLLYCRMAVRLTAQVATIGLNPGGGKDGHIEWANDKRLSDESGNSYFVEQWAGDRQSPLQTQVQYLAKILNISPDDLLSTNLVPFRSPDWASLRNRSLSVDFGLSLLDWALASQNLKMVVTFGLKSAENLLVNRLDASLIDQIPSGWGNINARLYQTPRFHLLVLPHLSRFRLFGRPQAERLEKEISRLGAIAA